VSINLPARTEVAPTSIHKAKLRLLLTIILLVSVSLTTTTMELHVNTSPVPEADAQRLPIAAAPAKQRVSVAVLAVNGSWALDADVINHPHMEPLNKEVVFYQDQHVTVTQARFISQGKTYAMSNISSVSLFEIKRSRILEILMIIIGLFMLAADDTRIVGVLLIMIAIALFFLLKNSYSVRIQSTSGEADGLISKDGEYVNKIVSAVNEAIIFRG
jgi:hypothetical protein